jgi:hypothetical protein
VAIPGSASHNDGFHTIIWKALDDFYKILRNAPSGLRNEDLVIKANADGLFRIHRVQGCIPARRWFGFAI